MTTRLLRNLYVMTGMAWRSLEGSVLAKLSLRGRWTSLVSCLAVAEQPPNAFPVKGCRWWILYDRPGLTNDV